MITAAIPIALLAINPPSCSAFGNTTTTTTKTVSASTKIVIKAGNGTCWKADVDDQRYSGCDDRTFTSTGRKHRATVWKTDGDGSISVSLVTDGRTVDQGSVRSSNHYVQVDQQATVNQH